MDNTIDISKYPKIYEGRGFWIIRLGGSEYESFYLIVSDQRAVANLIAIKIMPDDVKKIIDSRGDLEIVDSIAKNLRNGYLYVK